MENAVKNASKSSIWLGTSHQIVANLPETISIERSLDIENVARNYNNIWSHANSYNVSLCFCVEN